MADNIGNDQSAEKKALLKQGEARIEKKNVKRKIVDFLFSDKLDSIGSYILYQVIGPSINTLIYNIGSNALRMAFFGNDAPIQSPGGSYIPGQGYRPAQKDPYAYQQISYPGYAQPAVLRQSSRIDINDVSFSTEKAAYDVLNEMCSVIAKFGKVRAADFYEFCGISGEKDNWTLGGIGWYTLANAKVLERTDGRYIIDFPPVQELR